jgi:phosphoribosylanthranilate isomerase
MTAPAIKICGITRVEDALAAVASGATMLGLNFYPGSPRCITLQQAREIAAAITAPVKLVGVFVNMNVADVLRIARAVPLHAVQLHGDESPQDCSALAAEFEVIRALPAKAGFNSGQLAEITCCRGIMLDAPSSAYGGSGASFDWASVDWTGVRAAVPLASLFLAGGLNAANVAEAIAIVHPDVVDVCSGVESVKGIKSADKMRAFVAAVRAAERQEP